MGKSQFEKVGGVLAVPTGSRSWGGWVMLAVLGVVLMSSGAMAAKDSVLQVTGVTINGVSSTAASSWGRINPGRVFYKGDWTDSTLEYAIKLIAKKEGGAGALAGGDSIGSVTLDSVIHVFGGTNRATISLDSNVAYANGGSGVAIGADKKSATVRLRLPSSALNFDVSYAATGTYNDSIVPIFLKYATGNVTKGGGGTHVEDSLFAARAPAGDSVWIRVKPKTDITNRLGIQGLVTSTPFDGTKKGIRLTSAALPTDGQLLYEYIRKEGTNPGAGDSISGGKPASTVLARNTEDTVRVAVSNAGTYIVRVALSAPKDSAYDSTELTITPKRLSNDNITISGLTAEGLTYNGKTQRPFYEVKDAASSDEPLQKGRDFKAAVLVGSVQDPASPEYFDNKDAGTGYIYIEGIGNYSGYALASFEIKKKDISVLNVSASAKPYDGTVDFPADSIKTVTFDGLENAETFGTPKGNKSYTLRDLTLSSANVGGTQTLIGYVDLDPQDSLAKNYNLEDNSFTKDAVLLKTKALAASDFDFTIPTNHYYNGQPRGIGDVAFKYDQPSGDLVVGYTIGGTDRWGDTLPTAVGSYTVKVKGVGTNTNFTGFTSPVTLASGSTAYSIKAAAAPTITKQPASVTVMKNREFTLSVTANSPNGTAEALSYVWYKVGKGGVADEEVGTGATYTQVADYTDSGSYKVVITNDPGDDVQLPATATSNTVSVKVTAPAQSLETAAVTVKGSYTYTGATQTVTSGNVVVVLDGKTLGSANYDYVVSNAINAGVDSAKTGIVTVTGKGAYEGQAIGTFYIAPKKFDKSDIATPATVVYDGTAKEFVVKASGNKTGLSGTVAYLDKDGNDVGIPTNAGEYNLEVTVSVAGSPNFLIPGGNDTTIANFGKYQIVKRSLAKADLDFDSLLLKGDSVLLADVKALEVSVNKGDGYGTLTVLYGGKADVPTTVGSVPVTASVSGGENYYPTGTPVTLGTLKIVEAYKYAVKFDGAVTGGAKLTATVAGKAISSGTSYVAGTAVKFTAKPNNNFAVASWSVNGVVIENTGNTYETELGTEPITVSVVYKSTISVLETERVIPGKSVAQEVAIAPVKVVASAFSAGPSPVSKAAGKIAFFSPKAVKSGTLYVFDAAGNSIAKIAAKSGNSSEIASWNLKDKKGATVAVGTYVVKGSLTGKDGKREIVSFVFSVTQ